MDKGEGISILLHPSTSQLPTCPNPLGHRSSDPDTVGHGPFRLLLRSVKRKGARLDGTLTMADPTKLRVMREIYDSQRFPALMVAAGG
jgi:hypothetical protein